jgi:hypothetical protein
VGIGRANMAMTTMSPPQHGQYSGQCDNNASGSWSAAGSMGGMSRSLRQSASFAA